MSALNDCWMIYQVASGSSVGHRTWAECSKASSEQVRRRPRLLPTGMFAASPDGLTGDSGLLKTTYSVTEQGYRVAKYKDACASQAARFVIFASANLISLTVWVNNISRFTKHNLEAILFKYFHMKLHLRRCLPDFIIYLNNCLHSTTHAANNLRSCPRLMNQNNI